MDLPLLDNNAAPATRQPGAAISFSSGAGGGGGLLDAASSVASAVGVDISGDAVDPWQRSLVEIISETNLAPAVDLLKIVIASDSQSPDFALQDEGDIQLGYSDELHPVFTGSIAQIQRSFVNQATVCVCNAGFKLSQMRLNESFEQQAAGDIVASIAGSAGVATDAIEPGIDFPFYVIDESKTLYQHIAVLAEKCGFIVFVGTDGKLNFMAPPSGEAVKTFVYGVDIIDLKAFSSQHAVTKVKVVGQGAAGSQGNDAWNWLVKDPASVSSESGDGDFSRLVSDHSIRSAEAAQQAAASKLFLKKQQSKKSRLKVTGAAEVFAGSRIAISDVPDASFNGEGVVETVRHHYSKQQGFISEIVVLMDSDDNSLDLLGALGGLF